METAEWFNKIVFPAFPSTYSASDINGLFYIPRNLAALGALSAAPAEADVHACFNEGFIPAVILRPTKGKSNSYVLYSHGNACDLGQMMPDLRVYAEYFKVNVVGWEYPGYGVSPGKPNGPAVKKDIKLVFRFLTSHLGVPLSNLIIFGRSIGTGPSSFLAEKIEKKHRGALGGLILQSGYTSIRAVARQIIGFVGVLAPTVFDNETALKSVHCPLLLIHGEKDNVIASYHSDVRPFLSHPLTDQTLHGVAVSPKKTLRKCPEADHNNWDTEADILKPILSFLSTHHQAVDASAVKDVPRFLLATQLNPPPLTAPQPSSWFSSSSAGK